MRSLRGLSVGIAMACGALLAPAPRADARGALTLIQDACLLMIGPDYMLYSAYQPAQPRKRFCEDLPSTGEFVFAVDFAQEELRAMKVDFRLTRDIGEDAEQHALEDATVAYLPPRVYPAGSVALRYNFVDAGNYAGIVTADGPHGEHWVARFPFAVARPYPFSLPYYLLLASALGGMALYFWGRGDSRRTKPREGR
ncbi:MAG TPA: hypothetical protein VK446_10445 [Methylocystis sp.]|nr:hypothetical protein [Methylocystis sp.]